MCGRIVWRWDAELEGWIKHWVGSDEGDRLATEEPAIGQSRFNITPGSHIPVALDDGARRMQVMKWAFPRDGRYTFNTRIETAATSPMWHGAWGYSHCIVPVTGFYEWKAKVPYFIQRKDGKPLLLAGLHAVRRHQDGPVPCVSIITRPASHVVARLHHRMPLALDQDTPGWEDWLHPDGRTGRIEDLARSAPDVLAAHPVGPEVNHHANEGPHLVTPLRPWF